MGQLYHSLQAQTTTEERVEKNVRARRWGDVQGKMFSGHGIAFALMNSLQLWLSAQDLYKIGLISFSSMIGEWPMWPHPSLMDYEQLWLLREGYHFFVVVIGQL